MACRPRLPARTQGLESNAGRRRKQPLPVVSRHLPGSRRAAAHRRREPASENYDGYIPNPRPTGIFDSRALRLRAYEAGELTVAQIAAEFGVTRPTIYRHLDKLDQQLTTTS
jgi:DNA invertase Pin-like site-specific DNA recombinase